MANRRDRVLGGSSAGFASLLASRAFSNRTFADIYETDVKFRKIIKKYLSGLGLDVSDELPRCGSYGCIIPFNENWILKLTSDQTDAAAAKYIMDHSAEFRKYSGVPNIRNVFSVHSSNLDKYNAPIYGIVMPRLIQLNNSERSAVERLAKNLNEALTCGGVTPAKPRSLDRHAVGISRAIKEFPQAKEFIRSVEVLADHGIHIFNMDGSGNVLKNTNGKWVIADLGWSSAPEQFIPYLSRRIANNIIRSINA